VWVGQEKIIIELVHIWAIHRKTDRGRWEFGAIPAALQSPGISRRYITRKSTLVENSNARWMRGCRPRGDRRGLKMCW
jgi:hypothetical protein